MAAKHRSSGIKWGETFFPVKLWGSTAHRGNKSAKLENLKALARDAKRIGIKLTVSKNHPDPWSKGRATYSFEALATRPGKDCPAAMKQASKMQALAKKHKVKFHEQAAVSIVRTTPAALKKRAAGWNYKGITKCPVKR